MTDSEFPAPKSGFVVTHFLVVSDQDRSREFYRSVFGAVEEVRQTTLPATAPRVPMNFLPQSAGISTDLHLSLGDGTAVDFLVVDLDGRIENGRRRAESAK